MQRTGVEVAWGLALQFPYIYLSTLCGVCEKRQDCSEVSESRFPEIAALFTLLFHSYPTPVML